MTTDCGKEKLPLAATLPVPPEMMVDKRALLRDLPGRGRNDYVLTWIEHSISEQRAEVGQDA